MKIVFCASEVFPFAKTGGLADVCGALPIALEDLGAEVVIFLPKYQCIDEAQNGIERKENSLLESVYGQNIKIIYIENEHYYGREGLYGDASGDYSDNLERFVFFCTQVLETLKRIDFQPDVIHCHDWQTALIPIYLKEKYNEDPFFHNVRSLFTIHNLAFQGIFPREQYAQLQLSDDLFHHDKLEYYGNINLLKAAIIYADEISTVSDQYAREIQTKHYGCGLEKVFLARDEEVDGIVNGIDYAVWNPEEDSLIKTNYSADSFEVAKLDNKQDLMQRVNLPFIQDCPVFGFVGRISHQKGIDLLAKGLDEFMHLDVKVVIQGVGEEKYYDLLKNVAKQYPEKLALCFEFDEKLAHQIYAGSDFFLMPSTFEPCGLSQLISMRYGTIPLAYKTGGLVDTIVPFNDKTLRGSGFIFDHYTNKSFLKEIERAIKIFRKKDHFHQLIENAFNVNFSWEKSAQKYLDVYKKLALKEAHAINS